MNLVIDSSVIIKWFVKQKEEDRTQALAIRDKFLAGKINVIIPDLVFYEIANVLKTKRGVKPSSLHKVIELFFLYPFEIIWPSEELLQSATKLAYQCQVTIYDAVYLALAHELDCLLVTADTKLCQSSPKMTKLLRQFAV